MNDNVKDASDEDIIRKILKGEEALFAEIVRRYQNWIVNVGMMFFRNRDDALDFAQEVFVRAYEGLASYGGRARFRFWLMKVAYHHAINTAKKGIRPESLMEHAWEGDAPDKAISKDEIRNALKKAIKELPEHYRVCIDLYFFYELSYREISKITGFPVNTIKSNVFRAKQLLRDSLKGTIAEDYHDM